MMARALYAAYRTVALTAPPNLSTATVKAVLTDHAGATPNTATHDFLNNISAGTVATSPALTGKTFGAVAAGVFDADDVTFTGVSGPSAESFSLFVDTGNAATSRLLSYWDDATGLPITPSGGNIIITWSASGVYTF
jgi:hypothetical protein